MSISKKTLKQLLAKSGNICAFPGCKQLLSEKQNGNSFLGEICHIEAQSVSGPRFNPSLSVDEIDSESNLMILCPTHHKLIDDNPDRYTVEVLKEIKENHESKSCKQEIEQIESIVSRLMAIEQRLSTINERDYIILTAKQLDEKLKVESKLKSFGINCFQIDDESFQSAFSRKLHDEEIIISCRNKEEGIYCIINELLRIKEKRPILIVYNEEGWKHLKNNSIKEAILIPFFHLEDIFSISGNTNIFVMSNIIPAIKSKVIELRPRTYETITSSLISAGMERNDAYDLVEKNHGLFALMRKRIYKGIHEKTPKWADELPPNIIKTCLLLSQWTDEEGDKEVVCKLSGMAYDDLISQITKTSKDEDSLIHIYNNYGKRYYFLANAEDAWTHYSIKSNDIIWNLFFDLFRDLMSETEKLMVYDTSFEKVHAEIKGEKFKWSGIVRSGLVHSLMIKSYFFNDEPLFKERVDDLVSSILTFIKDENGWRFISYYIKDLTELSPNIVLNRLESEFINPTGLKLLFDNQSDNFLWKNHFYINVVRALEQMLLQREYVARAFDIIVKINAFGFKYQGNSPEHTIKMVLCSWANFSAIKTIEEKKYFAEKLFKYDKTNAWNLLYSLLPENQHNIIGELSKPEYRDYEKITKISKEDLINTRNIYFNLLIDNATNNPDYWSKLLEYGTKLTSKERAELFDKINDVLKIMTDSQKASIKDEIRVLIYHNRFFKTSAWTMDESNTAEYEKLLESISVDTKELDYCIYFNKSPYEIPLDHPVSHEDSDYIQKNTKLAYDLVKLKINQFKEQHLNLNILIKTCTKYDYSYLGYYLALYWNEKCFDMDVFHALIRNQKTGELACSYYENVNHKNFPLFKTILDVLYEEKCPQSCILRFYKAEARITSGTPAICEASAKVKKAFWARDVFGINNTECAINECKKYGNASSFIELLYFTYEKTQFDNEYLFEQVKFLNTMSINDLTRMDSHYLSHILKPLQQVFLLNDEKRNTLTSIELKFFNLLEWNEMICTQYEVKKNPTLYTDLLRLIFIKDEGIRQEKAERSDVNNDALYRLFEKMHFCPAEENGEVKKKLLQKWIERFNEQLSDNKQTSIRGMILGRLFAYSPAGKDGFYPCETIRDMIEKETDSNFFNEYHVTVWNNRGTYTGTSGREEAMIARRYKETADYFAITHPKTASIYRGLADSYLLQAKHERVKAENGF